MIQPIENWLTLDEHGIQFPWYTRPCLDWLNTVDFTNKSVFEYGVGYSTLWYKSRGAITFGVDDNQKWSEIADSMYFDGKEQYLESILKPDRFFDFICIDGMFRDDCIEYALSVIKVGGFVIIDNYKQATADLPEWPKTEALLKYFDVRTYKEPSHQDWATIVIQL